MSRPYSKASWKSWGWDWTPAESDGWVFAELTTGEQLYREGQAMSHCVNTYAQNCISGRSAIVSLLFEVERRITIEIHPPTKRIVQARGRFNRLPAPNEQKIIDMWFSQVVKSKTISSSNE
ncbi:MAG: PcfJ domain-containing protein [Cyclobacteriaceae bacterium]